MVSSSLWHGFTKSCGVIFASEIGDKTFFIAALMAMRNPRFLVFSGCIAALALMTLLSTMLGWAAPSLISQKYTHWGSTILFFYFGFRSLYDVFFAPDNAGPSELEEVEAELEGKRSANTGKGGKNESAAWRRIISPIIAQAFTLTFLAEWGDRSQITTIGLAASANVVGVTLGGVVGHAVCTGAAVLGGKQLASHIDERTVGVIGGVMFLIFGALAVYEGPNSD